MTQAKNSLFVSHESGQAAKAVLEALDRIDAQHSLEIQKHMLQIRQLQQADRQQTACEHVDPAASDFVLRPFRSAA